MFEIQLNKGGNDVSFEQLSTMNATFKQNYIVNQMNNDRKTSQEISNVKNDANKKWKLIRSDIK